MAIGEAGSLSTNSPTENQPINVSFTEALTDPVIALTGSNTGGNPYTFRVTDIQVNADGDATGFTFIIEEWEYLDGPHGATEDINWLAIEAGVHTLPDGRIIEAGTTTANGGNSSVSFAGTFTDPPVVLTSVMSENDTTTVDSDPFNISNTGFTVSLQEEEAEDDIHADETVGYIAVQGGAGEDSGSATSVDGFNEQNLVVALGDTFVDPVTLGETQTFNGGNPANVVLVTEGTDTAEFFLQEEQSNDNEVAHVGETLGVVTFEDGVILCFTPDARVDTPFGARAIADLTSGDLVITKDNGARPLLAKTETLLSPDQMRDAPDLAPVLIRKDALGRNTPNRDLLVSPQHRLLISGWNAELLFSEREVLVPAKALVNNQTICVAPSTTPVTYIHLVFDRHEIVTANNVSSESLHAGDVSKHQLDATAREALFAHFPDLRTTPNAWHQPARPVVSVHEARALLH